MGMPEELKTLYQDRLDSLQINSQKSDQQYGELKNDLLELAKFYSQEAKLQHQTQMRTSSFNHVDSQLKSSSMAVKYQNQSNKLQLTDLMNLRDNKQIQEILGGATQVISDVGMYILVLKISVLLQGTWKEERQFGKVVKATDHQRHTR